VSKQTTSILGVDVAYSVGPDIDSLYEQLKKFPEFLKQYGEHRRNLAMQEVRFWESVLGMEPTMTARERRNEEKRRNDGIGDAQS